MSINYIITRKSKFQISVNKKSNYFFSNSTFCAKKTQAKRLVQLTFLVVHHNRGIRTSRLRNRIFGFFFFYAVFVRATVSVGVIGKNQVQKQLVFLPACQIKQHFHFVVVKQYPINKCVNQCLAVFRLGIVQRAEMV